MEQKSHHQINISIKEEITDTTSNCSSKESSTVLSSNKNAIKGSSKDTNDNTMDVVPKVEKCISPLPAATNCKNIITSISQPLSVVSPSLNVLRNGVGNSNTIDSSSPPLAATSLSNNSSGGGLSLEITSKNLSKIRQLLSTLLQFSNSLNAEVGESVKNLILNLACNLISIEEFHRSLQEATNFPLRPFVLPFLKNYVPILQKEISLQAKLTKQNVKHYVRQNESSILDPFGSTSEVNEVFNQIDPVSSSNQHEVFFSNVVMGKRRYECHENNILCHKPDSINDAQIHQTPPPVKKQAPSNLYSSNVNNFSNAVNNHHAAYHAVDYFQIPTHPFHSNTNGWPPTGTTSVSSTKDCNTNAEEKSTGNSEWNNIYVMLNCISSMVEKTKRALAILQERNTNENNYGDADGVTMKGFNSDHHTSLNKRSSAEEVKRTLNELMVHTMRLTEERVAFVRKKAEEAVNEVKRQAITELQKAIASSSYKTVDGISNELLELWEKSRGNM